MLKTPLKNTIFLGIFYFFSLPFLVAQNPRYGLQFNSFEVVQEQRTSLNLSPVKAFSFPEGFSLSFDICYQPIPEFNFGYVFRIIGQNGQHIDFLLNPFNLAVVHSSGKVLADCYLEEIRGVYQSFSPFSILFDVKNNRIDISIGEKNFSYKEAFIQDFKTVDIIFGRCNHSQLQTSDVPKIIIKDICINDMKGEALYYWQLSKHTTNGVYDEEKNHLAIVENPKWLLDDHAIWKKQLGFSAHKNPQIANNSDENSIAIADNENFHTYNTQTHTLTKNRISSGIPHSHLVNQIVYNPLDKKYYSYCFSMGNGRHIAAYNATGKNWENQAIIETDVDFWHHNKFVSAYDSSMYLFGGYGHHKYKNYINKYSFQTRTWEKVQYKGGQIQPRYLSGLGAMDENRILLFGGYGNETGMQELAPHNYYDLFEIDLRNMTARKIWELGPQKNHFVVANSLVVDTLNKCFYALCFPQQVYHTSLFLGKFSMEKPEYEVLASIPFDFQDVSSYADLFLNKKNNELSAITYSSETTDSMATVSIYSLSYPPLSASEIHQLPHTDKTHLRIIYIVAIIACLVVGYFIVRKKKGIHVALFENIQAEEEEELCKPTGRKDKKQAVLLFGGFHVNDKNGANITGEFSPLLKQLFLIILLNTMKEDGKGISSSKLKETLWFEKSMESARNNRGVMLNKLRQIFEQIGMIQIESKNSYWIVKFGDGIYCDYCEALILIRLLKQKINRTKEDVLKLVSIVSAGELLPNTQMEWTDIFKSDFVNDLIDLFLDINTHKNLNLSMQECVNLANAILIHDTLNEDALKLKCSTLVKMGKNGLAKSVYLSYVKKYAYSFGARFKYSFEEVIS
jgi:two-component SAPR family response regulator